MQSLLLELESLFIVLSCNRCAQKASFCYTYKTMWILYTLISILLLAVVNYFDEYLTAKNTVESDIEGASVHKQVGGLILASTLAGFIGAGAIAIFSDNITFAKNIILLSSLAGFGSSILYASYFYLLFKFPVWQVVPLFQMSTAWLIIMELAQGETITLFQVLGLVLIIGGSYVVDTGSFRWKIPSRLLLYMIPLTIVWSFSLFSIKTGVGLASVASVSFWQFLMIGIIGLILLIVVKPYREGLFYRVKTQGKLFLGGSFVSESLSLISYFLNNIAIAIAPLATFVSALFGAQGVFLLFLFLLFPIKKESIKPIQICAIITIAIGVFFIST